MADVIKRTKFHFLVLFCACLSLMPALGAYKMLDPTDSFFVEAAREMLELSHYVTPLINYSDWLDKPALPFICIIASYKMFGINEWAARLPSALSAIVLVLVTFSVVKRIIGLREALYVALILCTSPLFLIVGHLALTDMPLTMLVGVSMLAFAESLIVKTKTSLFLAYFALALAILCKGPIGLILVMGSLATYFLSTTATFEKALAKVMLLKLPQGVLFMLVACLPYYVLAHHTTSGAFTRAFFLTQNLGRFAGIVNHQEPMWFYLPVFMGGYFPWTIFFMASAAGFKRFWRHRFYESKRAELTNFCASWLFFGLLLFTIVPTKLPTYIVPMSPALAILVSIYLENLIRLKQRRKLLILGSLILLASSVGILVLAKILPSPQHSGASVILLNVLFWLAGAIIVLGETAHVILLRQKLISKAMLGLFVGTYLGASILVPVSFCRFYQIHQAGLTRLIELAKTNQANLATLFCLTPSATFCYHKKIDVINSLSDLSVFCRQGKSPHWLLAMKNCLEIPELHARQHIISKDGKWYLLSVEEYLSGGATK